MVKTKINRLLNPPGLLNIIDSFSFNVFLHLIFEFPSLELDNTYRMLKSGG